MYMESIRLSPKKNGKGYLSSYSVNISCAETKKCGLDNGHVIKIIDEENSQIVLKARRFSLTTDVVDELAILKTEADEEAKVIAQPYFSNQEIRTTQESLKLFADRVLRKLDLPAEERLVAYMKGLSLETLVDLTIVMYLGRDFDGNTSLNPGEERFWEFYDRYDYLILGKTKDELISTLLEKIPMIKYIRNGLKILDAPVGTSLSEMI